jgi:outer membrane immunogenic protein
MTNRWFNGVAIVALTAVGTVAAQAADLPTRKEAPAPVFVPPPFTWTGFYVGVNVGGAWTSGNRSAQIFAPAAFPFPVSTFFPGSFGSGQSGVIGGGQAGYNWQTGSFVLGVETDFDGTSLSKTFDATGVPFSGAGVPAFLLGDTLSVHAKTSLDWLGSTRGRVGWVPFPDNRWLIYGTGGVAYGGGSANFTVFDATQNLLLTGNPSSSRVGWVAGGGVEYALTNNWTIKAEYLYYNLGKSTFSTAPAVLTGFTGVFANGQVDYRVQTVRAGVNYKF